MILITLIRVDVLFIFSPKVPYIPFLDPLNQFSRGYKINRSKRKRSRRLNRRPLSTTTTTTTTGTTPSSTPTISNTSRSISFTSTTTSGTTPSGTTTSTPSGTTSTTTSTPSGTTTLTPASTTTTTTTTSTPSGTTSTTTSTDSGTTPSGITPSTSSGTTPSGTNSSNSSNSTNTSNPFPRVKEFDNLDQKANLKAAKKALSGLAGVYSIICNVTGAIYIGSSIDIGTRLVRHLVINNTNEHLQLAITKYGLENFTFCVVEFYDLVDIGPLSQETNKANLLALEQKHLDRLFSLPESFRYNFLSIAGSSLGYIHSEETRAKKSGANHPMYGKNHTPETLALMSEAKTGANNPMYGRTHTPETLVKTSKALSGANHPMYGRTHTPETLVKISEALSGANNPMYGKYGITPTNAMTIDVYDLDNVLVRSFTSQVAAAEELGVSNVTVSNYIKSRKVWKNKYTFRKSS